MRIIGSLILVAATVLAGGCKGGSVYDDPNAAGSTQILDHARVRLQHSLELLGDTSLSPRNVENGAIRFVESKDWTSGFFPGMLWMMYEYTGDESWEEPAHHYTMNIEQEQFNAGTHDMGFKLYNSFGNGYRLTQNSRYKKILLQGASTLITRFNPLVGCIRSWDHNSDKWNFPVIIDNMMNLELLFWATRETRDSSFYHVALRHAETTMENHFRDDHSTYHVIAYDPETGEVVKRNTHQGYSHESAWARGQAWGLYGFTMTYRETGDNRFLEVAREIARYLLEHPNLPADKVPYWDFDAPGQQDIPRDVSAAAIMASALYELSTYCPDEKDQYVETADQILNALSNGYTFSGEQAYPFLLEHSTGSFPYDSEVDVPIIYADYYYLEALLRKTKLTGDWEGEKADVIIKVDDLRYDSKNVIPERWGHFVTYMEQKQVPAAIGLICESLEQGAPGYADWIIQKQETGLFEFWNHGYDHSRGTEDGQPYWEFRNRSRELQKEHLLHSQELAREHLGFELVTFGAPYNQSDQATAEILEEISEIEHWLFPPSRVTTSKNRLERIPEVNIEYPVHNPSAYHFWNNYYFYSDRDLLIVQGHPNSWDQRRFKEFERIINYMKELEVEVILPRAGRPKS
ncbi:MAG: glycoside hydrolase family 88 protein [Bacteroidales bacterium]|nr:glycoside hydrolase family 88 protein [Bacteroidales bacterium]